MCCAGVTAKLSKAGERIFGDGTNEYDLFWSPFGPEGERLGETAQERNKAIVRRAIEKGWNGGDLSVIEELYAPNFVFHQEGGGAIEGVEAFKQWVRGDSHRFPRHQVHDQRHVRGR